MPSRLSRIRNLILILTLGFFAAIGCASAASAAIASEPAQKVLIDSDPGTDDALAILLAVYSPEVDVKGISIVAGNVKEFDGDLGLVIGAKVAAPDKFCVNIMGDAAFGMTGLDFETAARCGIPITTIVLNNSTMAIETHAMALSHERYRARDLGGNYANIGRDLGGWSERVEDPSQIGDAIPVKVAAETDVARVAAKRDVFDRIPEIGAQRRVGQETPVVVFAQ